MVQSLLLPPIIAMTLYMQYCVALSENYSVYIIRIEGQRQGRSLRKMCRSLPSYVEYPLVTCLPRKQKVGWNHRNNSEIITGWNVTDAEKSKLLDTVQEAVSENEGIFLRDVNVFPFGEIPGNKFDTIMTATFMTKLYDSDIKNRIGSVERRFCFQVQLSSVRYLRKNLLTDCRVTIHDAPQMSITYNPKSRTYNRNLKFLTEAADITSEILLKEIHNTSVSVKKSNTKREEQLIVLTGSGLNCKSDKIATRDRELCKPLKKLVKKDEHLECNYSNGKVAAELVLPAKDVQRYIRILKTINTVWNTTGCHIDHQSQDAVKTNVVPAVIRIHGGNISESSCSLDKNHFPHLAHCYTRKSKSGNYELITFWGTLHVRTLQELPELFKNSSVSVLKFTPMPRLHSNITKIILKVNLSEIQWKDDFWDEKNQAIEWVFLPFMLELHSELLEFEPCSDLLGFSATPLFPYHSLDIEFSMCTSPVPYSGLINFGNRVTDMLNGEAFREVHNIIVETPIESFTKDISWTTYRTRENEFELRLSKYYPRGSYQIIHFKEEKIDERLWQMNATVKFGNIEGMFELFMHDLSVKAFD